MTRHPPAWLAWPLAAVPFFAAATRIASVWVWPGLAEATYADSTAEYMVDAFSLLGACAVGAVVASRRPEMLYGWLLLSLGLAARPRRPTSGPAGSPGRASPGTSTTL